MTNKPPKAIPSASMIVLRDSSNGIEVLVARRNPELRMAGDFWVFPGGVLDKQDQVEGDEPLSAFLRNARRETLEEVGLNVAQDTVVHFAHWITPVELAMRFDTHFFVVQMPSDQQPVPDGSEIVEVRWLTPQSLVEGCDRSEFKLMFPTLMNARRLIGFDSVKQALDRARLEEVKPLMPGLGFTNGKPVALIPEEAGYGITEWEFPYPVKIVSD
ncbi:NUDIX hydrolase [Porticoccaceae bacterium LTM1]|nr:NUDIX hydrolase [Porticoccaceae bacterium LTM1]